MEEEVKNENSEKTENIIEQNNQSQVSSSQKSYSIASMILGIVSLVLLPKTFLSIVCGILAIIFGIKGKNLDGKGMAKAGFIMGIVSLSLVVAFFLFGIILGATFFAALI